MMTQTEARNLIVTPGNAEIGTVTAAFVVDRRGDWHLVTRADAPHVQYARP